MIDVRIRVAVVVTFGLALSGCNKPAAPPVREAIVDDTPERIWTFEDVATAAQLTSIQVAGGRDVNHIIDSIGSGAAWLDYDGDGATDLYLAQGATRADGGHGPPDLLLRNLGDRNADGVPEFEDVTESAGLGDRRWSFGVSVVDIEGDGDPDIYLSNWGPNRLYRNEGDGTFREIGRESGSDGDDWSVDATFSDVDGDGDLDLYVSNYVVFDFELYPSRGERPAGGGTPCVWKGIEVFCGPRNLAAAPDRFYRNDGLRNGVPKFTEATREAGLETAEPYFALTAAFVDADGDGDDDLYVANDSVQNSYFINDGSGRFVEDSILSGLAYNEQGLEQAGMGIAAADYNGDGRFDLAVTNFSHDHDTLYRNEGDETFSDVSYPAGIATPSFLTLGWGLVWSDLDLDGWEDLVVAHGHVYPQVDGRDLGTAFLQPDGLYRNQGDGTFSDLSSNSGAGFATSDGSRAVAPTDIDGDGDLDLLITQWNARPKLLRNELPAGRWVAVRLIGAGANRDAIGAQVAVTAGGRRQLRQMRRKVSFGSTLPVVHFGIGDAESIESLVVRWPGGGETRLNQPPSGQLHVVRQENDRG